MAATNNAHPSLLNRINRTLPDGSIDRSTVELLAKNNPAIRDASWMPTNDTWSQRSHVRTSKPSPGWRKLNEVSAYDKSTTAPITDNTGILEKWMQVESLLVQGKLSYLESEQEAFLQAFSDEMEDTLFNGNENAEPEAFTGFSPRFNATANANADNIFAESASDTDATSIWLIDWDPKRVCMIYPKDMTLGLWTQDDGEVTAESHAGQTGPIRVFRKGFRWVAGLHVKDWRGAARFQFDPDDVVASGSSGPVLDRTMRKMVRRVFPSGNISSTARWYMNRDALDCFDLQGNEKATLAIPTVESAQGEIVDAFQRIPLRQCDAITTAETSIV